MCESPSSKLWATRYDQIFTRQDKILSWDYSFLARRRWCYREIIASRICRTEMLKQVNLLGPKNDYDFENREHLSWKKTAMKIVHVQGQNDTAMKRVNKYFGIKSECHGQNGNGWNATDLCVWVLGPRLALLVFVLAFWHRLWVLESNTVRVTIHTSYSLAIWPDHLLRLVYMS